MKYMKNFLLFYNTFEVFCSVRDFRCLDPKKNSVGVCQFMFKNYKKKNCIL